MPRLMVDRFLDLVQRSKLVEPELLARAVERIRQQADKDQAESGDFLADELIKDGLLTRWQCDKLMEGRHKGFFLGKYKLLGHLGSGGMSHVYLGEHVVMQRRVAIKVLPKNKVEDSSYLARFHLESQAAAALDHPNIVRAYDVDNDQNTHFFVMEYVEGRDLQNIIKEDGPLDYDSAANYIAQAAAGLQHAHAAHLIHRDIKPANLLVDNRGTVKVLDLGLARFSNSEQASLTVAHDENVLGTADYLSPEQAMDSHSADHRADIYSLGCTLYFLLTGHPPFPDGTLIQRLMKHKHEKPPSILVDRPDAPRDLVAICEKMMKKAAADRYQSSEEVHGVLIRWLASRGKAPAGESGKLGPAPRPRVNPRHISTGDTVSDLDQNTIKGPARRTGDSQKGRIPKARSIDEDNPFRGLEFVAESTPRRSHADPSRSSPSGRKSGAMAKSEGPSSDVDAAKSLGGELGSGRQRPQRRKSDAAPRWLLPVVLGGIGLCALILILGIAFGVL